MGYSFCFCFLRVHVPLSNFPKEIGQTKLCFPVGNSHFPGGKIAIVTALDFLKVLRFLFPVPVVKQKNSSSPFALEKNFELDLWVSL